MERGQPLQLVARLPHALVRPNTLVALVVSVTRMEQVVVVRLDLTELASLGKIVMRIRLLVALETTALVVRVVQETLRLVELVHRMSWVVAVVAVEPITLTVALPARLVAVAAVAKRAVGMAVGAKSV